MDVAALVIILSAVLFGPLVFKPIEHNVEVFFLAVGVLTAMVTGRFDWGFVNAAVTEPASLAIHASGRKLTVSWKTVADARTYLVHVLVTKGDGATLIAQVTAPNHEVTLTDAAPIKAATVTVTPESVTGLPGRAATVTFPTQKTKTKGK